LEPEASSAARTKRKRQKAKKKEARATVKQQQEEAVGGVGVRGSAQQGLEEGSPVQEQSWDADTCRAQREPTAKVWGEEDPDSDAQYWGEEYNPDPDAQYWNAEENPDPDAQYWDGQDYPDPDAQYWGDEENLDPDAQYWRGEGDAEADENYASETESWSEMLAELLGPDANLPRASSCPCLPAWCPLLDSDDDDCGRYDGGGDPDIEDFFDDPSSPLDLWPPTPESTPPATPSWYYSADPQQQRVVWMPVPVTAWNSSLSPHNQW